MKQPQSVAMHRAFLDELQQKKAALENELQVLSAVERYHLDRLADLQEASDSDADAPSARNSTSGSAALGNDRTALALIGATKFLAAKIALQELHHPSKVGEIVEVLLKYNYGGELGRRILFNAIFTAMSRRKDVFTRNEDSRWSLLEWGGVGDEQAGVD
jgi:hypothetical protein